MTPLEQTDADLKLNLRQRALIKSDLSAIEARITAILADKENLEMAAFDVDLGEEGE